MSDTLTVLGWARGSDDPVVSELWRRLCESVREPVEASAEGVMAELGAYGGNTIANVFRSGRGPDLDEVVWDVAEALRGWFEERTYSRGDVNACERFVLGKMNVSDDDLRAIGEAVRSYALRNASERQWSALAGAAMNRAVAGKVAVKVAEAVAERVAVKVGQEVAEEVAARVLARIAMGLNVVLLAWTVVDLAGPARRVTLPAVTWVALLRNAWRNAEAGL